ncbi:MAG: rod shape-determining protein RodA [Rhodospirillaceae bacterium]|nr:rod shape-determining protein RodA [Rhodospirillaceae bacterium]
MSDGFYNARLRRGDMAPTEKLFQLSWSLLFWVCCIFAFGFAMLYSAGGGSLQPWAGPQLVKFIVGVGVVLVVAMVDIRILLQYAYVFYGLVLILLVVVDVKGIIGMGAQRWIDLGVITLQPSELMKPALIMALARYFQGVGIEDIGRPINLLVPVIMTLVPVALIIKEPDLGTALLVLMSAAGVLFMAGVRMWKFALVIAVGLGAIPVIWPFLHDYQQNRVLTFLNPERDPLGDGYHILQSKIALGSGGLFGKGFMDGTQSRLNFLPEKQTDFIFTMLAEELGMVGALGLLALYVIVLIYGYSIAFRCRHQFGRLVAMGLTTGFFLFFFINIAMVMGLLPVVGVTLPFISYGGTSLLTLMLCVGILMNVHVHRDIQISMRGGIDF